MQDGRWGVRYPFLRKGEPSGMTNPLSGSGDGARISTTVKQYDPAKGYGFLVPVDGPPEIFCRDSALAAVGLDTLLAGTTVSCETVQGRRGPEVSRILAVDFSTASSGPATPAPAPVILAASALDALSILALDLVPAHRKGAVAVSCGSSAAAALPEWIQEWNPQRIFCAYDATTRGDRAAKRLIRNDNRIVRLRPPLDGEGWNETLIRDRAGVPFETDDRRLA